ncbi:hypothetical protein JCM10212_003129 [Sporobolomyces blumeae]
MVKAIKSLESELDDFSKAQKKKMRRLADWIEDGSDIEIVADSKKKKKHKKSKKDVSESSEDESTASGPKKKSKKDKKPKDPDAPKRPASAYILWANDAIKEYRDDQPGVSYQDAQKWAGQAWKNLSEADKAPYQEQYDEAKEEWHHNVEKYEKKKKNKTKVSLVNGSSSGKKTKPPKIPREYSSDEEDIQVEDSEGTIVVDSETEHDGDEEIDQLESQQG